MEHAHPKDCRCRKCRPQCPPRVLLPRVMGSGRDWQRCLRVHLQVEGVDPCAPPPYTLVEVIGEQPLIHWEEPCCCVTVPLICRVMDGRKHIHTGHASLTVRLKPALLCRHDECWRYHWFAAACVRLVCTPPCGTELCFDASVEVITQVYLIKWESMAMNQPPKPPCPQLPLYPQPCCWER